jgi:hypothetical protein
VRVTTGVLSVRSIARPATNGDEHYAVGLADELTGPSWSVLLGLVSEADCAYKLSMPTRCQRCGWWEDEHIVLMTAPSNGDIFVVLCPTACFQPPSGPQVHRVERSPHATEAGSGSEGDQLKHQDRDRARQTAKASGRHRAV